MMHNEKIYEKIQQELDQSKQLQTLESWINTFKETFGFSVRKVNNVLKTMISDQEIVIHDDRVYYIDGINYGVGIFRLVRENFGFVEGEIESFYVAKEQFNGAIDQDTVLIAIKDNGRKHGEILKVIKHNRSYLLGTMERRGKKLYFIPYDTKILQRVTHDAPSHQLSEHQRVIGKITAFSPSLHVEIVSILGMADEPGMDVLSVLYVYGLTTKFSDEVLQEASSAAREVSAKDWAHRIDHRDQLVVTVDGEDAKDLDDAISMETLNQGYRLYVHIADVSHYVKAKSQLDQSALERSSSIYMVDRVVPMLPQELSNGVCSLHPHVDRLTLTCRMDLDFQGNIMDYDIYESVIHSKRRLSYKEVNSGQDLGDVQPMIELMLECARRLNHKRTQAGSIDFDSEESQFLIDDQGNVLDVYRKERGESETMIEAFMVMANETVSRHCRHLQVPVLYRVHEKPTKEKMQELSHTLRILGYRLRGSLDDVRPKALQQALEYFTDKPEFPVVSRLMLRAMNKAKYSEIPLGHFGLSLEDYAHFTSPIRRYPDLLLHQNLKKYVLHRQKADQKADEVFVSEAGIHVSKKERTILEAERQVEKMKKAQYMQAKIGEVYDAIVSGISNYGIFVELANTVEGLVHVRTLKDDFYHFDAQSMKLVGERSGRIYALGQKVKVKLMAVDMIEWGIDFELLVKRKGRNHENRRKKPKSAA